MNKNTVKVNSLFSDNAVQISGAKPSGFSAAITLVRNEVAEPNKDFFI